MTLDLDKMKSLMELMREHRVSEIEHESNGERLRIHLEPEGGVVIPAALAAPVPVALPAAQAAGEPALSEGEVIKSPMVGTFYGAPKPGAPPFVSVGDTIGIGQTLCIVEAMKLLNEIDAEVSGTILEVLVDNETPVQFGQPLFRIKPT